MVQKISSESVEKIKNQIKKEYGTLQKFAEKLGTSPENITTKLKNLSHKFASELEENGIEIDEYIYQEISGVEGKFEQKGIKKSIAGKFSNVEGGISYGGTDNPYIQVLNDMIDMLKSDKKKLEERVAELEKENKELRANR